MSTPPPPGQPASAPARVSRRRAWFAVWLVIGAGYTFSLLSGLSIGLFLLPLPVLATILLAPRQSTHSGLPGLISGLGIPVLYVAYLNRAGPGTVCTAVTGGGQDCADEWSPWPWLAAGVILLVLGIAAFTALRRRLPPAG